MDKTIALLKSLLLPILEEDLNFHRVKLNDAFWDFLIKYFLNYEEDAKPTHTLLYALQLNEPELVLNQLPQLFSDFINDTAENYVLGRRNNATEHFITAQNPTFLARVSFFQTLEQAIKKVERENIKSTLPKSFERLTFEVPDIEVENVTKKRGREDLKSKFKEWDKELEVSNNRMVFYSLKKENTEVPKVKVVSLSWVKYAGIAAVFIIGLMILQPTKSSNEELFASYNSNPSSFASIDYSKLENTSDASGTRGSEYILKNYSLSETETALQAVKLFNERNFENAKKLLTDLSPKEKNPELLIFLAIAQLNTNDIAKAISNLEFLYILQKYSYSDEVEFHLAMAYIKVDKINEAKSLLKSQIKKEGKHSKQSSETLKRIRWF
jgi:hypothetical protein